MTTVNNLRDHNDTDLKQQIKEEHAHNAETLPRHLLAISEQEKASLAQELHDELGSNLMLMRINLTSALDKFGYDNPELTNLLQESLQLLKKTADIKCRIIEDLRPSMLENLGLAASIRSYCEEIASRSSLEIDIKINENFTQINPELSIALYRIVQESLTNTIKYAKATRASVSLTKVDNGIRLCISDNGIGIVPEVLKKTKSHGILGMRERAILNGGSFNISLNKDGRGTRIDVFIPYAER